MNPDSKLLKACIRKDRKAQEQLYRLCFPVMMGICMRYFRNESDGVSTLNEAFLKILANLKKKKSKVPFEAWVRRITINTAIDKFRKNKNYKTHIQGGMDELPECQLSAAYEINRAELRLNAEDIEMLIHQLPPMSLEVFNLFAIDGYSHKEIAELLGISVGTSKWHVSFARKELKEKLMRAGLVTQNADML